MTLNIFPNLYVLVYIIAMSNFREKVCSLYLIANLCCLTFKVITILCWFSFHFPLILTERGEGADKFPKEFRLSALSLDGCVGHRLVWICKMITGTYFFTVLFSLSYPWCKKCLFWLVLLLCVVTFDHLEFHQQCWDFRCSQFWHVFPSFISLHE